MSNLLHLVPKQKINLEKKNPLLFNLILFIVFISILSCFLWYKYKEKNKLQNNKNIELLIAFVIIVFFIIYIIL